MPTRNTKFYSLILVIADSIILLAAFTVAYIMRVQLDNRPLVNEVLSLDYASMALTIIPFWIIVFAVLGLYNSDIYNRRLAEWSRIAVGTFIGILLIIGWEYVTELHFFPARLVAVYAFGVSFLLIVFGREILRIIREALFRFGRGISRVLIIGDSAATSDIARSLMPTATSGYDVVAMAGPKKLVPSEISGITHFTSFEDALKSIKKLKITTIIQTDLYDSAERNQKILGAAQINHVQYSFIPGEPEFYSGKNTVDIFLGYPMISVSQTPLIGWGAIVKRLFDILFIVILSPIWLPFFLLVCLLQKIFNPGPLFFNSERLGLHGKKIDTYKFRSMKAKYSGKDAAEIFRRMGREDLAKEYEKTRKIENDPRITPFGNILRKTSLDELPQIFNVLRGELSLVGPRPIIKEEKHFYKDRAPLLFSVRPGITGLWQVSGRSDLSFNERVELELYYAQNWTFWLDIKILFKTIGVVLFRRGVK